MSEVMLRSSSDEYVLDDTKKQVIHALRKQQRLAFDAALAGHAVCLADRRLTGSAEAAGSLVRINPLTIDLPQGIYVVLPETERPDPRVLAFADWLKDEARAVGDGT